MRPAWPSRSSGLDAGGHGADARHGRFALSDERAHQSHPGLIAATERLLTLGQVNAHGSVVTLDGLQVHHLETGSGAPIVLIHGASGGSANWYRLMGPLSRRHRVLAVDLPGFGLSDALEPRAPLGEQIAALLLRWLDAVNIERCAVIATSFGGLAALRLAQRAPHRVAAVALTDSVGLGRELPLPLRVACTGPLVHVAVKPCRLGMRWQFHELMVADGRRIPRVHVDALLEYLWQSAAATNRARLARAFSLFSDLRGQREVLTDEELRDFRSRLLVMWGQRDRFLPLAHGRRAADLVPCALLRIISNVGHSPNWEAPEAVLDCLSAFLRDAPSS